MDIKSVEEKLQLRLSSYQSSNTTGSMSDISVDDKDDSDSFHTAVEQNSVSTVPKHKNVKGIEPAGHDSPRPSLDAPVISDSSNTELQSSKNLKSHATSEKKIENVSEFGNDNLNLPHPAIEFPPLYFLLRKFPSLLEPFQRLYTIRWNLSYPLQRRIPGSKILRKCNIFLTYGELFLVLPFVAFFVLGTVRSFVDPSVSITGHASRTPLIFAFATGMRNSFLTLLIGIPFERSLWYHKLAGRTAFVTAILHTYVSFVHPVPSSITGTVPTSAWPDGGSDFVKFCFSDSVNTGGTVLFLAITAMLLTSVPYIRRKVFEVFFYIHVIFATACLGCAFYHTGVLIPILGSLTWGVDVLLRKVYMAHFRYPKQGKLRHISDTVVELSFPKTRDFDYNPGQYVRIAVPDISMFEWHPFSLSSCPLEDSVTICIRKTGTWTNALHKLADTKQDINILLEGPYGSLGVDLFSTTRYKMIMLLSGGIGVTPMQSICNQLVFEHATKRREIQKLCVYWMERDPTAIQDMDVTRRLSSIHQSIRSLDLDSDSISSADSKSHENFSISSSILSGLQGGHGQNANDIQGEQHASYFSVNHEEPLLSHVDKKLSSNPVEIITGDAVLDQRNMDPPGYIFLDEELAAVKTDFPETQSSEDAMNFLSQFAQRVTTTNATPVQEAGVDDDEEDPYGILDMNMFLTAKDEANKVAGHPFIQVGRPDLVDGFLNMRTEAIKLGEKRVAVCVCAPAKLVLLCKKACVKYSDAKVRFDLHEEIFG